MISFLNPPTFNPPVYAIPLGTTGQVLTMVGGRPQFSGAGGGGGGVGTFLANAPTAGVKNNFNPPGFGVGVGRLDIDTTAGDVELTGLASGADAQLLIVTNTGANNLILDPQSALSVAANRFRLPGQMFINQFDAFLLCYYAGGVNRWCMGG